MAKDFRKKANRDRFRSEMEISAQVRCADAHNPVHIATGLGEQAADLVRHVREPFRTNVLYPKGK